MTIVGSARVVITADTSRLESSVRDAFASIDFSGIGGESADRFADGYNQKIQGRMPSDGQQAGQAWGQGFAGGARGAIPDTGELIGGGGGGGGARRRGKEAGDEFGSSFNDALKRYEKSKKQAPFEGLITGLLDNIHQIATTGIGLSAVAGMLYQVGAAVVAIGASAGAAIPALGALGNILGAAFQGMTVAKSAFSGVGEAMSAMDAATSAASQSMEDAAEKALQIAQAKLSLKRATLEAGRAEEDARVALERAQRGYKDALDNEIKAQERVTEARKNAKEKIIDMKFALEDSVLSEERAVLSLKKAEKDLAKARAGGNANAIYEADLAYREQELSLRKLQETNKRLGEDADKTFKEGVDGNEQVKDSLKAQEQAAIAVTDAQRALNREMEDGPLRVEQAMLSLQQAQLALKKAMEPADKTAVDALNDAMDKLHPNAQWFVKFYKNTIQPFIDDMKKEGQGAFFEGFNQAVQKLWDSDLPGILRNMYVETAGTMGAIADKLAEELTAPGVDGLASNLDNLESIFQSNVRILDTLGEAAKNMIAPFLQIGDALTGPAERMAERWRVASEKFKEYIGGMAKEQVKVYNLGITNQANLNEDGSIPVFEGSRLELFFYKAEQRLLNIKDAFKSFGGGVKQYFGLAAEGGDVFFEGLKELGTEWSNSFQDPEKIERLRQGFKNAAENALTLMEIIGNIMGAFSQLGAENSMGELLETVKELTESEVFTEALVSGAGAFMDMLQEIVESLGPMMAAFAEMQTLEHFFNAVGFIFDLIGKVVGVLAGNPIGQAFLKAAGYVVAFTLVVSLLAGIFLKLKQRWESMKEAGNAIRDAGSAAKAKLTGGTADSSGKRQGRKSGEDTAGGFEDGVRSQQGQIAQAARDLAAAFINTFKAIFRMSSPSLVMFEAGVDIVKGLVLGIRTAAPELQAALRGLFVGQTGAAATSGTQLGEAQMEALQAAVTANTAENITAVRNSLGLAAQAVIPAGVQTGDVFLDSMGNRIRVGGPELAAATGTAARSAGGGMAVGGTVGGGRYIDSAGNTMRLGGPKLASAAAVAAKPAGDALAREGERGGRQMVDGVDKGSKGIGGSMKKIGGAIGGVGLGIAGFLGPMLLFSLLGPQLEQVFAAIMPAIQGIIDTVMPFIQSLIATIVPVFQQLLAFIMPILQQIFATVMPILQQIFDTVAPIFMNLIATIMPIIQQIFNALAPIFQTLMAAFVPVIQMLISALGPLISMLLTALVPIFQMLASVIQALMPIIMALVTSVLSIFIEILAAIIPIFLQLVETLLPVFMDLFQQLQPLFQDLLTAFMDLFMAIAGAFLPIIKDLLPVVATLIQALVVGLLPVVLLLAPIFLDLVMVLVDALLPVVEALLPVFLDLVLLFINLLVPVIQLLVPVITPLIVIFVQIVAFLLQFFIPIILKLVEVFFKFLIPIIINVITWFTNLFNGIKDAWEKYGKPTIDRFQDAFQRVKDFFAGVVDGIKERWNSIVETIKKPIKTIVNGINDWLIKPLNSVLSALGLSWTVPTINVNWGTSAEGGPVGSITDTSGGRGPIKFASGGRVTGRGSGRDDKIPTLLSHGEYVIKASSVKRLGLNNLNFLNSNGQFPLGGKTGIGLGGFLDVVVGAVSSFYDNTIGSVLSKVGDWIKKGVAFAIGEILDFGIDLADDYAGNAFGDFLLGVMRSLKDKVYEWAFAEQEKKKAEEAKKAAASGNVPPYDGPDEGWAYPLSRRTLATTYRGHQKAGARDFGVPEGTEIRAVASGRVMKSRDMGNRSYGQYIELSHLNGIISLYAHMSKRIAEVGKNVKVGEVIGLVGNTGNSFGAHLHLEVASPQDAAAFLKARGVKWLADGGVVRATEGGVAAILAEGGRSERVTPLDAQGRTPAEVELLTMMQDYLGKESVAVTNHIYPSPGMDERALAAKVSQEIVYQQRRRS